MIMKGDKSKALKAEIAALERKLFEAKAQYAATLGVAFDALPKAATEYHASGVILEISAIGGKAIIPPVMIRDGLSNATVKALQADIARSFELATLVNPAMATARHG
jgi:hypothetical protein